MRIYLLLFSLLITPVSMAVTFVDQPLLPDMTFAPVLAMRVRAPIMDNATPPRLQVEAVPLFKTVRYPILTRKQVQGRILPSTPRQSYYP
jgi:hypothetical protein